MNERDIFHAAIELANPIERSAYLEKVCADNAPLRRHVEDMLQVYPRLGTFLESPAVHRDGAGSAPTTAGRFRVGQELARGGMGIVYCARDESLGRDVAVKILHERYLADNRVRRRFLDEACITAQLQHPGIPPVLEVGRLDDARPYLAMKLIKGRTLQDLLDERPEPASDRGRFLAVFQQVCQTVAYAHSNHILHRDLKPANVMVGAFGEVQVMDWGLAKLLAHPAAHEPAVIETTGPNATIIPTLHTHDSDTLAGSVLGTPAFTAPEQAGGDLDRLDERADVFGLGAILCVILTGVPPYTGKSPEDCLLLATRGTLADAHARLDQCGADANLVELCRACLSAQPEARPRDAGAVAAAVTTYLAGVEERVRQAELERAAALVRAAEHRQRRRVQLTLAAMIVLALVGGIVATTWQAFRAIEAEADAVADKTAAVHAKGVALSEAERSRRLLYSADVHLASQAWQSEDGTVSQCRELLLAHVPGPGQLDLREFCWRYQWRLLHRGSIVHLPVTTHAGGVDAGNRVVTLDENGNIAAWRIGDRASHQAFTLAGGRPLGVTLSRNGEVATIIDPNGSPNVFDLHTGHEKGPVHAPSALVNVKLSADGRFLVGVGRDKHARVWDLASGRQLYDFPMIDASARQIDLSADGKQLLASATAEGEGVVLYRAGEEKPTVLNVPEGGFNRLQGALSPDGKLAAVAVAGNYIEFYDLATGKHLRPLPTQSVATQVTFSPDGNQFAVGERTGLITLWRLPRRLLPADQPAAAGESGETAAGQPLPRYLKGHQNRIEALAFTADGRKLVSIDCGNTARTWVVDDQEESRVLEKTPEGIDGLSYSPDGRWLAVTSMKHGIHVRDLRSSDRPRWLTGRPSRRVVFSADGRTIAGGPDHCVALWDAETGELLATLAHADPGEHDPVNGFSNLGALVFSPDGRWLAAGFGAVFHYSDDAPQKVMVFDVAQRKQHRTFATPTQVSAVAFSADGKLMAAAGHNGMVWLWDTATWDQLGQWWGPAESAYGSALFLSGGQAGDTGRPADILAVGDRSGRIDLWDVRTRALARQLHGHIALVSFMALSPDGRTLASASCDRTIKLWDTDTGRELRTLCREAGWLFALTFSPDGNTLASGGLSPVLRLWEASPRETLAADPATPDPQANPNRH